MQGKARVSQVLMPAESLKGPEVVNSDWNAPRQARRSRVVFGILHAIFKGELTGGDRLVEE